MKYATLFFCAVFLFFGIVSHASAATTYYVSNANSNGYTLGSDSNNGTSVDTPVLTIDKALQLSNAGTHSGDTVNINPSGTSYNGGDSFGLNTSNYNLTNVTIQTDQTLLGVGKATIIAGGTSSRVVNSGGSNGLMFSDIILDGQGKSHIITPPH